MYYCNGITGETQWNVPINRPDLESDANGDSTSTKTQNSAINDALFNEQVEEHKGESNVDIPLIYEAYDSENAAAYSGFTEQRCWQAFVDEESGFTYYVNLESGESQWEVPEGWYQDTSGYFQSDPEEHVQNQSIEYFSAYYGDQQYYDQHVNPDQYDYVQYNEGNWHDFAYSENDSSYVHDRDQQGYTNTIGSVSDDQYVTSDYQDQSHIIEYYNDRVDTSIEARITEIRSLPAVKKIMQQILARDGRSWWTESVDPYYGTKKSEKKRMLKYIMSSLFVSRIMNFSQRNFDFIFIIF